MNAQAKEGFIGSKLKSIPFSTLLYCKEDQLLLRVKRQIVRLDLPTQTMAYCKPDEEKVVHTTYHSLLELYLVLTEKHLMAINGEGQLVRKLPNETLFGSKFFFMCALQDGYKGVPNHREDYALFVKGDHIYFCNLQVFFERQLIKNKGICDFKITFGTPIPHESPEYIENSKLFQTEGMLLLWNANQTYIYSVPRVRGETLKRILIYSKISRRENLSLDYAVVPSMKLMAVGYESGIIKMYAFEESRKYLAELRGHQASCISLLVPAKSEGFLYSGSADSTVRIWNLYDFEQVYVLQLDLLVSTLTLITSQLLYATSDETHPKSYLCDLNADLLEPVVNQNQGGELLRLTCDGIWCIAIYSNNHVQFFPATLPRASNQKLEYPEKYGAVRDVFHLDGDYAVAFQNGFSLVRFNKWQVSAYNFELTKLVYNQSIGSGKGGEEFIQLIHEKLLGTYLFNVLLDWKEIPVSLKITAVYFHRSKCLPKWDGTLKAQPQQQDTYYCLLGSTKGEIFFVDLANRTHYYSKVHFHSAEITFIREVKKQGEGPAFFLSISADRQLVIWKFDALEPPHAMITLSFNREFTFKEVFKNYLVLGEKSGQLSIIVIHTDAGIIFKKSPNNAGHIRSVICGDYLQYKKDELFLSGGEDSIIKIWRGAEKQLIFQLKLFGIISAVSFIRQNLNLIVCHNEQISFIRQERLKSLSKATKVLEQPSASPQCEEIDMRGFLLGEKPRSPIKHHRLAKLTSRYSNFPKPFRVEELQSISEMKHIQSYAPILVKPPSNLFPIKSDSQQKLPRPRRFHISSTEEFSSDVSLPRIATKISSGQKFLPSKLKIGDQVEQMKKRKSKSYSRAVR